MSPVIPALAVTFAIQALLSAGIFAPPVLASAAQGDIGVAASSVGVFIAIAYMAATVTSCVSAALIARLGPLRVSQYSLVASALGLAAIASAHLALVVLGALLLGAAYGPATPASSQILLARAPLGMRATILSIKQTAVPFGGMAAGAMLPWMVVYWGWRGGALALALGCVVLALLCQSVQRAIDAQPSGGGHASIDITAPLRLARGHRQLRVLSIVAFFYSGVQLCFGTYLVVYLVEHGGLTLVAAGVGMSTFMLAGIIGRVFWGALADKTRRGRLVLAVLGVGSCTVACGFVLLDAEWSAARVWILCFFAGFTAIAWNGVQLAEVAHHAPQGSIAAATGMTMMFSYLGVVVAPLAFWLLFTLTGSYPAGFIASALFSALGALVLLRR